MVNEVLLIASAFAEMEARSKLFQSYDSNLNDVTSKSALDKDDVEIQDVLAEPLVADVVISSPSLFDETPTNSLSSHSSSQQITVQKLY